MSHNSFQNLLPESNKEALNKGYKKRFLIVTMWTVFFTLLISGISLLPVFFLARNKIDVVTGREESNPQAQAEQQSILAIPDSINNSVRTALLFKDIPRVSQKFADIEAARVPGIELTSFSYAPVVRTKNLGMTLVGVAKDRATLLSFKKEVEKISFVQDVTIPVENFAKDVNLDFTMTINLKQK